MKNIYFPDEEITFNDVFFVCYMIERTARFLKQRNLYVVQKIAKSGLERQLSIAQSLHCLNPEQVVDEWISEYNLEPGSFDITKVDSRFTDKVPTDLQMGKVYARLVETVAGKAADFATTIMSVYKSPICEFIDNYNSSAYYEPSPVIAKAFYSGEF